MDAPVSDTDSPAEQAPLLAKASGPDEIVDRLSAINLAIFAYLGLKGSRRVETRGLRVSNRKA
jgi:hypothetical protein